MDPESPDSCNFVWVSILFFGQMAMAKYVCGKMLVRRIWQGQGIDSGRFLVFVCLTIIQNLFFFIIIVLYILLREWRYLKYSNLRVWLVPKYNCICKPILFRNKDFLLNCNGIFLWIILNASWSLTLMNIYHVSVDYPLGVSVSSSIKVWKFLL